MSQKRHSAPRRFIAATVDAVRRLMLVVYPFYCFALFRVGTSIPELDSLTLISLVFWITKVLNYFALASGNRFILLNIAFDVSLFFRHSLAPYLVFWDCVATLLNVIFRRNDHASALVSLVVIVRNFLVSILKFVLVEESLFTPFDDMDSSSFRLGLPLFLICVVKLSQTFIFFLYIYAPMIVTGLFRYYASKEILEKRREFAEREKPTSYYYKLTISALCAREDLRLNFIFMTTFLNVLYVVVYLCTWFLYHQSEAKGREIPDLILFLLLVFFASAFGLATMSFDPHDPNRDKIHKVLTGLYIVSMFLLNISIESPGKPGEDGVVHQAFLGGYVAVPDWVRVIHLWSPFPFLFLFLVFFGLADFFRVFFFKYQVLTVETIMLFLSHSYILYFF